MKLKEKLVIAFIIMIILPIILITLTASSIIKFQMNSIHQSYDLETETLQIITNPVQIWNRITRGVYNEIKLNTLKIQKN